MTPRAVIVTGASGGIGGAVAQAAGRAGWTVILGFGSSRERAEQLARELVGSGGSAWALPFPLEDGARVVSSLEQIQAAAVDVRALVLCASRPPLVTSFLKTPQAALREQLETNVVGNHLLIAETWKRFFRPHRDGHVIGVLSASLGPPVLPHLSSYVVAKAGLAALLEAARSEFARDGLRVTSVSPDFTETAMLAVFPPAILERARARAPSGRFATPGEIAAIIMKALGPPSAERSAS